MKNSLVFRPFTFHSFSTRTKSLFKIALLSLYLLLLAFSSSFKSIVIVVFAVFAFLFAEFILSKTKVSRAFQIFDAIEKGLLAGLLLPESFPLAYVFFVMFFSHLALDFFSGNFAKNCVHEIVIVLCISYICASDFFPKPISDFEIFQMKNASEFLIENGTFPIARYDSFATASINNSIFHFFGISIPEGYVSLFWDTKISIPAFRFNALSIFTSIVLFGFDMLSFAIPIAFLFSYTMLVRFASLFFFQNVQAGDMLLSLCTSGTLFFASFILENAGTIPRTNFGKTIFGLIVGIFAFFIAGFGLSNIGMSFAVLCSTLLTPFILQIEDAHNLNKTRYLLRTKTEAV